MKYAVLAAWLYLFSGCLLVVCAQARDPRTKLSPEGRPDAFSVSPDGTLWLATYAGRTYFSPKLGRFLAGGASRLHRKTALG